MLATERVVDKAKAIAAHMLEAAEADIEFARRRVRDRRHRPHPDAERIAAAAGDPKNLPDGMEPGLVATPPIAAKEQNFPNGVHICELEIDPETGEVELLNYSVVDDVGTVMNPLLLEGPDPRRHRPGHRASAIGGHPFRRRLGPAHDRLVHGLRDAAGRRIAHDDARPTRCRPRTNPLGVKGAGEAGAVGAMPAVGNALV